MANMSYCRFRNTVKDLEDCLEYLDTTAGGAELQARTRPVELSRRLVDDAERLGIVEPVDK